MKLSIFIVFLIGMAGCTSPQSPVVKETTIAGLSIPDTIDFGMVRAGLSKTLSVTFQNTGSDTIHITSQTISDSFFQEDPRWKQFYIAPDSSRIPNITYIPHDSIDIAFDTLRSGNEVKIITLRGREVPFSSGLPSAPKEITINLTGVIGRSYGSPNTFSFYYDEPGEPSLYHDSDYSFSGSNSGGDWDYRGDEVDWWSNVTNIAATIDTIWVIKSLSLTYYYSYGTRGGGQYYSKNEILKLHDIPMIKTGKSYVGVASGSALRNFIDTISIQGDFPYYGAPHCNDNLPALDSLIGYTDSAKLSIIIQ